MGPTIGKKASKLIESKLKTDVSGLKSECNAKEFNEKQWEMNMPQFL